MRWEGVLYLLNRSSMVGRMGPMLESLIQAVPKCDPEAGLGFPSILVLRQQGMGLSLRRQCRAQNLGIWMKMWFNRPECVKVSTLFLLDSMSA